MKKAAIVTGGSRGIGFAIARKLGLDGYGVVIMATSDRERNQSNLDLLESDGTEYLYVQGNIADQGDRERCINETMERFGNVFVLVNNAGVAPAQRADLLDMSIDSFERVMSINTQGCMFMSQLAAKAMLKGEAVDGLRGHIVNISSISAYTSSINRGEYCVSKAGISMLTQLYAERLAPEGILVNEVRPGIIDTDMTAGVKQKYDDLIGGGLLPISRWGKPEDVANAVSVLCGGMLGYTTGQVINVDGGFHIRRL